MRQQGLKGLCVALFIAFCGCTFVACASDPEKRYQARFDRVMANGGFLREYSPLEIVEGASEFEALPMASDNERTIRDEALRAATEYAESNNSSAFMVWHKGKLQVQSFFGDTDASTPLLSKSLSKPLGAIAIGRAIELGYIESIDQSASDFIPEWKGTAKEKMRVRHILDMRSGFLAQGFSTDPNHPWNRAYLSYELEQYLINNYPVTETPGEKYRYSNATGDLVGIIIERATGMRYAEFIGSEVLKKIGAPGGDIWVSQRGGLAHAGCCMHLPAESWLRMGILLAQKGTFGGQRVLPEAFVEQMHQGTHANPHYGLGVWIGGDYQKYRGFGGELEWGPPVLHSEPYLDPSLYLFDGNANQVVYILPAHDMVIMRLGARPPTTPEWDNSILPNLLIRGLK